MNDELLQRATVLWEKGQQLSINPEAHNSLYLYEDHLFVIWYDRENILQNVERVTKEKAVELFDPTEWKLV